MLVVCWIWLLVAVRLLVDIPVCFACFLLALSVDFECCLCLFSLVDLILLITC